MVTDSHSLVKYAQGVSGSFSFERKIIVNPFKILLCSYVCLPDIGVGRIFIKEGLKCENWSTVAKILTFSKIYRGALPYFLPLLHMPMVADILTLF